MKDQEKYRLLISKWLEGDISEAEMKTLESMPNFEDYQKIAATTAQMETPDFDQEELYQKIKSSTTSKNKTSKVISLNNYKAFLRIAAVIAVIFGTYWWIQPEKTTVTTLYAEQSTEILPDQSEVILNSGTSLSYYKKDWDNNRTLDLKGQAYFKVAKGAKFKVNTDQGVVTVLGTQFNVIARKNYFDVVCYEGLVSVFYNGQTTKLPAGKAISVVDGKLTENTTASHQPSWLNNELSFKSIPVKYVLEELERQFNLKIKTKNINTNTLYTGTFHNKNLKLSLESICKPLHLNFTLEGTKKVLIYADKNQ